MTKPKKPCLTCRWAKWEMTKHKPPRIQKKYGGECKYMVSDEAIANLIPGVCASTAVARYVNINKSYLWADRIPDTCPVWEGKDPLTEPSNL